MDPHVHYYNKLIIFITRKSTRFSGGSYIWQKMALIEQDNAYKKSMPTDR